MKKKEMLKHWQSIEPNLPLNPDIVPYKHEGSTYDQDGIRITGSKQWIDSVLSRIKDLLAEENGSTRLQVVYKQSTDRKTGVLMDSFNCYIQVHERGAQAQGMNALFEAMDRRKGRETNYIDQL